MKTASYPKYKQPLNTRKDWLRNKLAEAQNWRCCLCGEKMLDQREAYETGNHGPVKPHPLFATIEHVLPRKYYKGKQRNIDLLAVSHSKCNNKRDSNLRPEVEKAIKEVFPLLRF